MKKLFLLLVILFSSNAFACTCIKLEVKKAFEKAGGIFIGEVIRVDSTHFDQSGYRIYIYDVKILKSYKSKISEKHEVVSFISTNDGAACDYTFYVGNTYLIYTDKIFFNNELQLYHTSKCDRTTIFGLQAEGEIEMLEKMEKEFKQSDTYSSSTITITEKEYQDLQKQNATANDLALKTIYLIITSCLLLVLCLIFIFLYIKTKRKLKAINH